MLRSKTMPLIAAAALLVSACGSDDGGGGGDKVSAGDFASDICTAFKTWSQSIQDRQASLQKDLGPGASPQDGKDALEGFLSDAVDSSDTLIDDVNAAGIPDATNGEDAANTLRDAAEQAKEKLSAAHDKVDDLPTDSPQAFSSAAGKFGQDVKSALEEVGSGVNEIKSPELDKAFNEESACGG